MWILRAKKLFGNNLEVFDIALEILLFLGYARLLNKNIHSSWKKVISLSSNVE
jgi:hypothetical protein